MPVRDKSHSAISPINQYSKYHKCASPIYFNVGAYLANEDVAGCVGRLRSCSPQSDLHDPSDFTNDRLHESQVIQNRHQ